jgi:serine/threonine protein kinase
MKIFRRNDLTDNNIIERFLKEIEIIRSLHDPIFVKLFDFLKISSKYCTIFEIAENEISFSYLKKNQS